MCRAYKHGGQKIEVVDRSHDAAHMFITRSGITQCKRNAIP
jgi:hypothetical protein